MNWRITALIVAVAFVWCGIAVAQQTGTLVGTAKDEQGGVLPGATVTISSPELIGGSQSMVTGPAGGYTFRNLPPGTYTVSFSMSGFGTYNREGIIISVATRTTVDGNLTVGSIEETITVTGESPVVDVKSTITQTNIDEEMYEAVPTGRNPWVMAGLVPGMVTGQLDVGGNQGMQQYSLEISGSADSQKTFSIDGLKVNWPGGGGGATMQYYDFAMYEEYNFQTSAGTAESDVAGVYMNMVTRSGGNELSGTQSAYFMNDSMQAESAASGRGNEIDNSYDLNGSLGGPLVRDKLWWFAAGRWWRLDQFNAGNVNPDGSRVIDDNLIRNLMAKGTWQIDDASRFFIMWNKNWKYRYHRNDLTAVDFPTSRATSFQKQPAQNLVLSFNRVLGTAGIFDVRFGRMWGETPYIYQEEIDQTDLSNTHFYDTITSVAERSAPYEFRNPNERLQFNATMSYYVDNFAGGTHDFKFGVQVGNDTMQQSRIIIGDTRLIAIDGRADEASLWNTPFASDQRMSDYGFFIQDAWTIGQRVTLNIGVRFDGLRGRVPAQTSPSGTWVGDRNEAEINDIPNWGPNAAPRIGLSYDLFGTGKTALKVYYGRFYIQTGTQIPENMNPVFDSSVNVPWNDLNGDLFLEPGPSGTFADSPELDLTRLREQGFVGGAQSTIDPDLQRPYSDNFDIGIQHEVMPNFSIGFTYHRRQHRRGVGRPDRNRPTSGYDPMTVNYDDPVDGASSVTVFNAKPEILTGGRDLFITNVDQMNSDYNGFEIVGHKRYSNNWQMLGGITYNSHKGFDYSNNYIQMSDFNNPNYLLNRDNGSVWTDLPWTFKMSGSYMFANNITLAGKWEGRAGYPETRRLSVSGLSQGTETVYVAQRGTDRPNAVTSFVDLSVTWSKDIGRSRIEPTLQIFNIFNKATILRQQTLVGSTWSNPTRYLSPRVLRVGIKWVF